MKKSQHAAPVILIAVIVFLLIYLILVYPSERARILNNETNVSEPEEEGLIFSSGEIVEVGVSAGESVFSFGMKDFYVAYPEKENVLLSKEVGLKATIFKGDSIYLPTTIGEDTEELIVRLNITEVKGKPKIAVFLNQTKLIEKEANIGLISVKIPKTILKEVNPIYVKIFHDGAFWTSQYVRLEINVINVYYEPESPVEGQIVHLEKVNIKGNEVKISFLPRNVVDDGKLFIKINNKTIFSGKVTENKTFSISVRMDRSGINVGDNEILFETEKGGIYNLTNVKLEFIAAATPYVKKTYSFNVKKEFFESEEKIVLSIKIRKIIKPGYLYAQIGTDGPIYYFEESELVPNIWIYVELDKEFLKEYGNTITLVSPNGRYQIDGFRIMLI